MKEWRDPLGSPGARRYVKIDRDKFGNRIFHVGLELYFDQIEAWKCVLSFDNYEQKGCHGHRHHADGSRTKIKMPELTVHEAIDWACDEIERKIGLERFRYQDELSNVYRNRLNYREGR